MENLMTSTLVSPPPPPPSPTQKQKTLDFRKKG